MAKLDGKVALITDRIDQLVGKGFRADIKDLGAWVVF